MGIGKILTKPAFELGEQAIKRWFKSGLLTKETAPQIVETLTKNIDLSKGADIPDIEVMLKGMKGNNDEAFGAFTDYTRTSQVREHINRKEALLTKFTQNPQQSQVVSDTSGKLSRSGAHKPWQGKGDKGPRSLIAGTPAKIIKKEPHNTEKAMTWARDIYAYAQQGKSGNKAQPLLGAPRYIAEDGTLFKPKTNTGAGKGYQLKFVSMDLLKGYDDLRKLREAPWRKQEVIDQLQTILNNEGEGDKLEDLLKLMLKDYNTKLKGIKAANQTKGHFISLDKGGLDIAENFGPQRGKSIKTKSGKWEAGNYAEGAGSSIPEGVSVPTTWEEYVALKLPLLK